MSEKNSPRSGALAVIADFFASLKFPPTKKQTSEILNGLEFSAQKEVAKILKQRLLDLCGIKLKHVNALHLAAQLAGYASHHTSVAKEFEFNVQINWPEPKQISVANFVSLRDQIIEVWTAWIKSENDPAIISLHPNSHGFNLFHCRRNSDLVKVAMNSESQILRWDKEIPQLIERLRRLLEETGHGFLDGMSNLIGVSNFEQSGFSKIFAEHDGVQIAEGPELEVFLQIETYLGKPFEDSHVEENVLAIGDQSIYFYFRFNNPDLERRALTQPELSKLMRRYRKLKSVTSNSRKRGIKINDFVLRFPGNYNDGLCRVRLFAIPGERIGTLVTDSGSKNLGPSVTNAVEKIYKILLEKNAIGKGDIFIEHYDDLSYPRVTCDLVTFNQNLRPEWEQISVQKAAAILNCEESELTTPTSENYGVINDMDRIRLEIDPHIEKKLYERAMEIQRREQKRADHKSRISALVQSNVGERELQKLLKSDLSILGDLYSPILHGEYIVFAEFPVGDGFVDFAVFSGRSRMDITLIEIKGADIPFSVRNSYGNFSQKVNEACQQLRARMGYTAREYSEFRKLAHQIRSQVEAGKIMYSSLIGPRIPLQVDPNKDVNIQGVVIGGRSVDDLYESEIRHNYETQSSEKVKVDSWDSWLRRI